VEIGAGDTESLGEDRPVEETDPEESEAEGEMRAEVALEADAEEPVRLESDLTLDALEDLDAVDVLELEDVALPAVASQRPAEAAASVLANTCSNESAHCYQGDTGYSQMADRSSKLQEPSRPT
jgi:hypothetical protein